MTAIFKFLVVFVCTHQNLLGLYQEYVESLPGAISCLRRQLAQSRSFRSFVKVLVDYQSWFNLLLAVGAQLSECFRHITLGNKHLFVLSVFSLMFLWNLYVWSFFVWTPGLALGWFVASLMSQSNPSVFMFCEVHIHIFYPFLGGSIVLILFTLYASICFFPPHSFYFLQKLQSRKISSNVREHIYVYNEPCMLKTWKYVDSICRARGNPIPTQTCCHCWSHRCREFPSTCCSYR